MLRLNMRDAQQQALTFLVQQAAIIEPEVVKVLYPEIQYPSLVPVDTSGNEWARTAIFFSMDQFGKADWITHLAKDIPLADVTRQKHERVIAMAGIGYGYSLEEIAMAMQVPGNDLTGDRAAAAKRGYEEFVDSVALRGDTDHNWGGLINHPDVTFGDVAADGTGPSTLWSTKTTSQIIRDINAVLTAVYTTSLTVELADTLLLPIDRLTYIATQQIPNTSMTILDFILTKNMVTLTTGRPLTVRGVRGLETAGAGGTNRMVAYRRDPDVLKMRIPMPHRFLAPMQDGPLNYLVPGVFRLGGIQLRRPKAMRYADGI